MITSLQIAEVLGKLHNDLMKCIRNAMAKGMVGFTESSYINTRGKIYPMFTMDINTAKQFISTLKGISQEQLNALGIDDLNVVFKNTRFETSFIDMLEEALLELEITGFRQFNVDGYRLDFFIPDYNLAIEYDEEQHYSEANRHADNLRQAYVENKIGAKFIRCDYRDSDIKNVMKVIKEVM